MKKELFISNNIPKGAIEIHLYNVSNVLHPRGPMKKESIGLTILERLLSTYESWTDPKMGDNPDEATLLALLKQNLYQEVNEAWEKFNICLENSIHKKQENNNEQKKEEKKKSV